MIAQYVLNMIPYMLIATPPYVLGRWVFLKLSHRRFNPFREAAMLLFVWFAVGLFSQTLIPKLEFGANGIGIVQDRIHETNLMPFKVLFETAEEVFVRHNVHYFLINFAGNIVMFIPFGVFFPLLWNTKKRTTVLIGLGISLFIELGQMFLNRGTDVDDLMLNTLGTAIGMWIFFGLCSRFPTQPSAFAPHRATTKEDTL